MTPARPPSPVTDPELVTLLRRCHPDEIEPLARLLRVPIRTSNPGSVVREIDRRVRRLASNTTLDLIMRRAAPTWPEALRRTGARLGLHLPDPPELAELAIARHELRRAWADLPAVERDRKWLRIVGPGLAPDIAADLETELEQRHPRSFPYFLSRLAEDPVVPLPGCLFALWLGRPRPDLVVPAVVQIAALRQTVRHRVTVGIVGSPSTGKDAALAAVFGIDTGNIGPIAGSTREIEIRKLPASTALYVVNTPGLGDVVQALTYEATRILDHIDLFLYVVNAQGGVQEREKADHAACVARGRPVLVVVNKVDTLREEHRARLVDDCRVKLGVDEADIVGAAFHPLPELAAAPLGVPEVRRWIERHLVALGKDASELPWVDQTFG